MSGWLTNGVPNLSVPTGIEQIPVDTELAGGATPQSASMTTMQLAALLQLLGNSSSKTTVAGSRYYVGITLGNASPVNGVNVLVGSVGGTDKWIAELHDSAGNLVATSSTSGVTAGAAGTFMQLPFTAQYDAPAGQYYIAIQSNGTTAHIGTYNAPAAPLVTGSATGTFGTGAAITPPTTYTAALGPVSVLY